MPLVTLVSKIYYIIVVKKMDQKQFISDARVASLYVWASSNNRIK